MKEIQLKTKKLTTQIEASKTIIAQERDKMRAFYEEIEDLLYDIDGGIESIEIGLKEIENGIDEISQKL